MWGISSKPIQVSHQGLVVPRTEANNAIPTRSCISAVTFIPELPRVQSRHRNVVKRATAVDKSATAIDKEMLPAPPRLPEVSNGLPPPLWSPKLVCGLAVDDVAVGVLADVVVGEVHARMVGALEVSTTRLLVSLGGKLDAVLMPAVTVEPQGSVCDGHADEPGPMWGGGGQAVVCGGKLVPVGALTQICCGPMSARKATIKFSPVIPLFPHAFLIGSTRA